VKVSRVASKGAHRVVVEHSANDGSGRIARELERNAGEVRQVAGERPDGLRLRRREPKQATLHAVNGRLVLLTLPAGACEARGEALVRNLDAD
jgi:hypothetical protein